VKSTLSGFVKELMTEELALHTAARRYCEEQSAYWHTCYAKLGSHIDHSGYTTEEKNTFPRYNVLEAILVDVERLRPESFTSSEDAREMLILAGRVGESMFTQPPNGRVQERAMREERELFCAYISSLDTDALGQVEAMPSRRALTQEESQSIWERVKLRWGMTGGYWYPLQGDAPPDAVAFDADTFETHIPARLFQSILSDHGLQSAFELREYGPEYELELGLVAPAYNGAEGYWTGDELDWLVYASHESTVTVAGEWLWLMRSVKERWATWTEHIIRW